jgi:hypothetical protein
MLVEISLDSYIVIHYLIAVGISLGLIGFGLFAPRGHRHCFNGFCRAMWMAMGIVDIFVTVIS